MCVNSNCFPVFPTSLPFARSLLFSSFVIVNSVAMEGDGCAVCRTSEAKLVALSHKLNCSQQVRVYLI